MGDRPRILERKQEDGRMSIRCPYCGSDNICWLHCKDDIDWSDTDCGVITTTNVSCNDCEEGGRGFIMRIPFITCDDVEYLDMDWNTISESE